MRKEVCCLCIAAVLFLLLGSLFPLIVRDQALTPFGGTAAVEEDRQLLGEITAGTVVEQPLPPGELHDIRLVFGTYGDRVTSHLLVEVVAEGETLYRTSLDGSSLRDNAGKSIVLPEALQLPPGACLRITSDDAVPGNALTLWTVPLSVLGAVGEEMALHVDGKAQGRVLCASWNTLPAHSTRLCAWEWGIAAVGGLLLAALLVFCAKASSFLVRAGAVGAAVLCYLLIVSPLLFVPDSVAHFLRSYVFIRTGGVAYLYPAGMEHIMPAVGAVLADALSPLQTVAAAQTFGTMLRTPVPLPLYSTLIPYLPQAFGMLLPYLFDAPVFFYDIGARLLNALCYALCCALACRVAPRSLRVLFAGVSLLPILLYFAASVSGDTLLNGAAILYTALLFHEEQTAPVRRRYGLSLMAVGILIMSAKATYAPLVLLHWLVWRRTGLSRAAWLAYDAALLLGAKLWNGYIIGRNIAEFGALLPGRETVVPALQQAYVLHHPLYFLALAGETFVRESGSYLHHLTSLGNLNVLMDVAFYLLVPYLLLLALGREQEQPAFALPRRTLAWGALACLASVLLIYLGLYMTWTPVGAPAISGVQGRYFLPLLPLLLILVRGALPRLQCCLPRLELLVLLLAAVGNLDMIYTLVRRVWLGQ